MWNMVVLGIVWVVIAGLWLFEWMLLSYLFP
jgi:hypothetical protein